MDTCQKDIRLIVYLQCLSGQRSLLQDDPCPNTLFQRNAREWKVGMKILSCKSNNMYIYLTLVYHLVILELFFVLLNFYHKVFHFCRTEICWFIIESIYKSFSKCNSVVRLIMNYFSLQFECTILDDLVDIIMLDMFRHYAGLILKMQDIFYK